MSETVTMKMLQEAFAAYIETCYALPDREDRQEDIPVKVKPLVPPKMENPLEDVGEGVFIFIEENLEEVEDDDNTVTLWEEDISFYMFFNAFNFEWTISFSPNSDVGFEVSGTELSEVVRAAYYNITNLLCFANGLPREVDIDEEWRIFNGGDVDE